MKLLLLLIITVFLYFSGTAYACTNFGQSLTRQVNFGEIIVQRDMPVGAVIATTTVVEPQAVEATGNNCTRYYEMTYTTRQTSLNNVYETNIPGVGIVVENKPQNQFFTAPPFSFTLTTGTVNSVNTTAEFRLVKTGPITGGTLAQREISRRRYQASHISRSYVMNSGTISVGSCTVNTPIVNVPLGTHPATNFSGIGSTTESVAIPLELDCNNGTRINAVINGDILTGAGLGGVLQVQAGAGSATGVGIQLIGDSNLPLELGTKFLAGVTSTTGRFSFGWQARYIQTAATILPGTANATATIDITYE